MNLMIRSLFCIAAAAMSGLALGQSHIIARLHNPADAAAVGQTFGITLRDQTENAPFAYYEAPAGSNLETIEHAMKLDSRVVWAEDEHDTSLPESEGGGKGGTIAAIGNRDLLYTYNSNAFKQISFDRTVAETQVRPVRVAVLDMGISILQPSIWSRVVASKNFVEKGQTASDWPRHKDTNGNGVFDEALGHGTMVAGLIYQLAPMAQIINAKIADTDGYSSAWLITKGLAFAVNNGAEVANISLGAANEIPALDDVLEWAIEEHNMAVVAPIGNNGSSMCLSPANLSGVTCVSGLSPNDRKAPFSNWANAADVSAPATGVRSFSYDGRMAYWSGTSFAAPMVTAAAANGLYHRTTPVNARDLVSTIHDAGDTLVNTLNPLYTGKMGLRLNCRRLLLRIAAMRQFGH